MVSQFGTFRRYSESRNPETVIISYTLMPGSWNHRQKDWTKHDASLLRRCTRISWDTSITSALACPQLSHLANLLIDIFSPLKLVHWPKL